MSSQYRPRSNHPYAYAARLPELPEVPIDLLLPGEGPVEIEIGPGRGGFLFERALARPEARLIGLEIRLKWSAIVDARLAERGLGKRARVYNGDAREALACLVPDASVSTFFMHFPDPWWKKRHEKRLVFGDALLSSIARLLIDGGELFIQTDVEDRAALYEEHMATQLDLAPAGDTEGSPRMAENPYNARSPREHRSIADGLPIYRLRYRRKNRSGAALGA
ncbi:MAG: tRNA (guanine-N7)-methyltransferase [Byssovorax sp.]